MRGREEGELPGAQGNPGQVALVEVGFIVHTKDTLRFDAKPGIEDVLVGATLEQVGLRRDVGRVEVCLDDAMEVLAALGTIHTPLYWRKHAVSEDTVRT